VLADDAGAAVVEVDVDQQFGDLHAVRADVLHRCRTGAAGNAGQALEAAEPVGHRRGHDLVPVLARLDGEQHGPVVPALHGASGAGDPHHGARPPLVRDHDVRAAAEQEHRLAGDVGAAQGVDHGCGGGRGHDRAGRSAEPQSGERGEPGGHIRYRHGSKR
jgi:hypothetical protein